MLRRHQALALFAQDPQKWTVPELAAQFKADPALLQSATEHCRAYLIVTDSDGVSHAEQRTASPGSTDFWQPPATT